MSENKALETEATADIEEAGITRRRALECMIWAGTGVLWTLSGGVPKSLGLLDEVLAAEAPSFTFLRISDSHIGFNKPANADALGTLREAIAKVKEVPAKPAFMIHTGDITHLSKPDESTMPTSSSAKRRSMCTTSPASTTLSMRAWARLISPATARVPRARAGTPSTLTACISSGS